MVTFTFWPAYSDSLPRTTTSRPGSRPGPEICTPALVTWPTVTGAFGDPSDLDANERNELAQTLMEELGVAHLANQAGQVLSGVSR